MVRWVTGFLDTPGAGAVVAERFWAAVTGAAVSARRGGGRFATLVPGGGDACLRVQVVGDGPARAHLDLHVVDLSGAVARLRGLGAVVVRADDDVVVLRSPAGLVFCVVGWGGERVAPGAVRWPGGQVSVADQLCLDIPAGGYAAEVGFWRAVTGWAHDPMPDSVEFERLLPAAPVPMRLLLQRVEDGAAGVHVDLACSDVAAEVARHEALGATVVRRVPGQWTTLRDPVGRAYCVTARAPRR
ncbi:VOC family protein [Actinoplanes teichomyceticus]|uniref:Glyoxalase-like domain-containing protein n=1 Tax=Actinoplanes teichomyceticus TaxID=1867 RepID=A0A561VMG3_ACTTI|nr:VOC family protein [Actinoplanes teichomyceticus]TWG12805.1 hypothetical protein FHX34_105673 [Actinoplanes teichomyceticus]GIF13545.1 hypothetical protein Ate01nite_35770 [Actinoplanes teichomyceticus]